MRRARRSRSHCTVLASVPSSEAAFGPAELGEAPVDDDQHSIQDSCEAYAAFMMQRSAEELGVAKRRHSEELWDAFESYLAQCGLDLEKFEQSEFGKYKRNADLQIPLFVDRLARHFAGATLEFLLDEATMRVAGLKGDVWIEVSTLDAPISLSLKNYIGGGGITRPQVSSGTYLSFACGFVFNRVGVGKYDDPRPDAPAPAFQGSNAATRNAVLEYEGRSELKRPLEQLEELNAEMREELLSPECEMYDRARVRSVVERIAQPGIETVLGIFDLLGVDRVRDKFLARIGMDGKEEALFLDADRYVDSITNSRYHDLRQSLNAETTTFTAAQHRQGIRFEFSDERGKDLLRTDVPFTVNTNGAWYRPRARFQGLREYDDKGHLVMLKWGQRRPYKSREIATSTNTYLNLARTGIFGT
jgi:hypothetical protein